MTEEESFLRDFHKNVDAYVENEIKESGGFYSARQIGQLVRVGLLAFLISAGVPVIVTFFVNAYIPVGAPLWLLLALALVVSVVGIVAFAYNNKQEIFYATEKKLRPFKDVAHETCAMEKYADFKKANAQRLAETELPENEQFKKRVGWVRNIAYFLFVAILTFALAIHADTLGFRLEVWYAAVPALVFIVSQVVICVTQRKICFNKLAAKVL